MSKFTGSNSESPIVDDYLQVPQGVAAQLRVLKHETNPENLTDRLRLTKTSGKIVR